MNSEGFVAHLGGGAPLNPAPTSGHALGQSCCGMTGLQHLRAWPKDLRNVSGKSDAKPATPSPPNLAGWPPLRWEEVGLCVTWKEVMVSCD